MPRVQDTVLAMHRRVADGLARYQAWEPIPPMRTLPSPVDYEWFELAKLWQEGYDGPIWFLADPTRTDLRLIDPQRRTLMRQYGWDTRDMPYVGGVMRMASFPARQNARRSKSMPSSEPRVTSTRSSGTWWSSSTNTAPAAPARRSASLQGTALAGAAGLNVSDPRPRVRAP